MPPHTHTLTNVCRYSDNLHWWYIWTCSFSTKEMPANKRAHLWVPLLTFAEVDGHALGLEQAVVLSLGVALGLQWGLAWRGPGQRVRRGGRWCCCGGSWGGGRGGMYLAVDWRDATWPARYRRRDELPAEAQQAAGDLVDVERGRFGTGTRAGKTEVLWVE